MVFVETRKTLPLERTSAQARFGPAVSKWSIGPQVAGKPSQVTGSPSQVTNPEDTA